ncbi:type I polyketide synthase [Hyalangium rubrum]|uniref:SDR family NAD(P)-dependent oxidoreductase n=1 Tax=Hyalangium rubrum TaxID=3103134 RepID=A0ABU5HHD3_9BACT|nr:SDR family NAD(P)-dependent oxidoreductase [Hyalangium sp. s54d21]MDY7232539.1 SDR family NAD(P)-dependent oxidoreductase [Hyalangium sp. s54d21]
MNTQETDPSPVKRALLELRAMKAKLDAVTRANSEPIAIIGMACRFPRAENPEAFWELLRSGVDAVSMPSEARWEDAATRAKLRPGGFLSNVDEFDPQFFGISPREAVSMDPQQRLLLEVGWEALENAGQSPEKLQGSRTGVFVGITYGDYAQRVKDADPALLDLYYVTGTSLNGAAGRLSYVLGLQGPCMSVDTACSSSLVAVHSALKSLRSGECELALVGGVNLMLSPDITLALSKAGALAPDGRCKSFDESADGYGRGEGCGVLLLKRLSDAQRSGDRILALIRGSAVNQDGPSGGFTVPNGLAQQELIRAALQNAGLEPGQVGYVEAHGTGTPLGDPIEVGALTTVLGEGREPEAPLLVGTAKANIGHLESASGVAGLIRVVLSMRHQQIPPHPTLKQVSSRIDVSGTPVVFPTRLTPWTPAQGTRIAGVSSFGISGTNAHVLLEEAPAEPSVAPRPERPWQFFTLSARSETALKALALRYAEHLEKNPAESLADLCHTVNLCRVHFPHRLAVVTGSTAELSEKLRAFASGNVTRGVRTGLAREQSRSRILPILDGSESDRLALEELARRYVRGDGVDWTGLEGNVPRRTLALPTYPFERRRCWAVGTGKPTVAAPTPRRGASASPFPGEPIRSPLIQDRVFEVWFSPGAPRFLDDHRLHGQRVIPGASHVSMLLAAAETALGGRACQVEDLNLLQPLTVADDEAQRVQLLLKPEGSGFSFQILGLRESKQAGEEATWALAATGRLRLSPAGVAASGALPVDALQARCERQLPGEEFYGRLAGKGYHFGPAFRCIDTLWVGEGEAVGLLRLPAEVVASGEQYSLHPGLIDACFQSLYAVVEQAEGGAEGLHVPFSLETFAFRGASAAGELKCHARLRPGGTAGVKTGDVTLFDASGARIAEARGLVFRDASQKLRKPLTTTPDRWLYETVWEPQPLAASGPLPQGTWLVLEDERGLGAELAAQLRARENTCITVTAGAGYERLSANQYQVDPRRPDEFRRLLRELSSIHAPLVGVVHLWATQLAVEEGSSVEALEGALALGTGSVLHLAQALARLEQAEPPRLWLVTRGAQQAGAEPSKLDAAQATLWGLGNVLAVEHPELKSRRIDLAPLGQGGAEEAGQLLSELSVGASEDTVLRGDGRRVLRLMPVQGAQRPDAAGYTLSAEGTYLISGGLGGLGLRVARWMAERGAKHLVLLGRKDPSDSGREAIATLGQAGVKVTVLRADVSKQEDVAEVLAHIHQHLPPLRGVVHAAGVLDDGVLLRQSWERFTRVFAPKVVGAWNLHLATRELPLDLFLLFSSVSCLIGSAGQGNYAAANAFLDGLAHRRRAMGLPALSINWGPWAEVGMAAGLGEAERRRWLDRGVESFAPDRAVEAMQLVVQSPLAQVTILAADWAKFAGKFAAGEQPAWMSRLVEEAAPTPRVNVPAAPVPTTQTVPLRSKLARCEGEERRSLLQSYVQEEVRRVLGFDKSQDLDAQQNLFDLGMDSLTSVELRKSLQTGLEDRLSATLLFDHPTIAELVNHLAEKPLASNA